MKLTGKILRQSRDGQGQQEVTLVCPADPSERGKNLVGLIASLSVVSEVDTSSVAPVTIDETPTKPNPAGKRRKRVILPGIDE